MTRTPDKHAALKEALSLWAFSIFLCASFGLGATFIPFIAENLLAFVAAIFLYLPAWILWKHGIDLADYGLDFGSPRTTIGLFLGVTIVVLPLFFVGHHLWQKHLFDHSGKISHQQLYRFSQEIENRPEFPLEKDTLFLWQEGDRLRVLWTGSGPIDVNLTVSHSKGTDAFHRLRGFRPSKDGLRLVPMGVAGVNLKHDGQLSWTRKGSGGFGIDGQHVDSILLKTNASRIRTGEFKLSAETPLDYRKNGTWWIWMFLTQIVLVALPEEWFYRGYLQKRMDDSMGTRWRVLGVQLGWGWILSSALFALGHLVLDFRPERLAVFFPSLLFGWMRARTNSIASSVLFHAIANVNIHALGYLYFG